MSYFKKLRQGINEVGSSVCLGLDTDPGKIPACLRQAVIDEHTKGLRLEDDGHPDHERGELAMHAAVAVSDAVTQETITRFNFAIIEATHDLVPVYKLNYWFYSAQGAPGLEAMAATIRYIHEHRRLTVLDFKSGDIGNSLDWAAHEAFELYGADAVTLSPYLGYQGGLEAVLRRQDKGAYVLCVTSNKGGRELQDLRVLYRSDWDMQFGIGGSSVPLFQAVADIATRKPEWDDKRENMTKLGWNQNGNVGLVTGATRPDGIRDLREYLRDKSSEGKWNRRPANLLIPAFGKQEGDVENSVQYACEDNDEGTAIFNLSRELIYASSGPDFAEAARTKTMEWRDRINACWMQPKAPAEVTP